MSAALSPRAQVVLLLMAPLIGARKDRSAGVLTPTEYRRLVEHLHAMGEKPESMLGNQPGKLLDACGAVVDRERLGSLLGRGFLLAQVVERWQARGIWVASTTDGQYPSRWRDRLGERCPPIVYGCGDGELLESGGLAVVGSRRASEESLEFTRDTARLAAEADCTVVSGGARGVDQAAMRGALDAGGRVGAVLADSLERAVTQRGNREVLMEGRLAFVSPYDPGAGFNVGHAMHRNKLIYALADAALVVSSDRDRGGTWAGATEQLGRLHFVQVYVHPTESTPGLDALVGRGARRWPNPHGVSEFNEVLSASALQADEAASPLFARQCQHETEQGHQEMEEPLPSGSPPDETVHEGPPDGSCAAPPSETAARLFSVVRRLVLCLLQEPLSVSDIAERLGVTTPQARAWLKRLEEEGAIGRQGSRPVRFVVQQRGGSLSGAVSRPRPRSSRD